MKKHRVLKLIGLAIGAMCILVLLSILEVAFYAYLVNPGQAPAYYEQHADFSAPLVSGFFGFILFFLVARYWKKQELQSGFTLAMLFPLTYILLDVLVLLALGTIEWSSFILIMLPANAAKYLGSYLGYKLTNQSVKWR